MRDGQDRSTHSNRGETNVKRTVALAAGLAALGVVAYIGSHLSAQAPATAQAPAQTRIAVINLQYVVKNYAKAKFYQTETEEASKPFVQQEEKLKSAYVQWNNYITDPKNAPQMTEEKKLEAEKNMTAIKRQIEDNHKEFQKIIGKKQEQQVVQLYKEISEHVKAYAAANGFHLVLSYFEPSNTVDVFSGTNIRRKLEGMSIGATCNPMYAADGMDISGPVVESLNRAYPGTAAAAPANGAH
jgi:Skp family chaperone for outer membrane proteins